MDSTFTRNNVRNTAWDCFRRSLADRGARYCFALSYIESRASVEGVSVEELRAVIAGLNDALDAAQREDELTEQAARNAHVLAESTD